VPRPKVFLVEDDADTREMIGRFLEMEGYEVETAANGRQALEHLDAGTSACVILLDLMMPVMDGWEFRRRQASHATGAHIPVIVFSAAGSDRMRQIEANDYLSKPVNLDDLLRRIARFCPLAKSES
jgi:CheY-like chemotaxis protein